MKTAQRIFKNTTVSTAAEIINKILSLFLYVALANYLLAKGFGQFSLIMMLLGLFEVLANFGLDKLTIRDLAKNTANTRNYLTSILKIKLLTAALAYALFILTINIMSKPPEVIYGVALVGLSLFFVNLSNTFMSIFNAHEKLEVNAVLLVIVKLIIFNAVFVAMRKGGGLIMVLGCFTAGEALRAALSWLMYAKEFSFYKKAADFILSSRDILKSAIPFVMVSAASLVYMRIDTVMISAFKGDTPVGWYSAAYTLIVGLMFIPRSYALSVYPVISRYVETSKEALNTSWLKSMKFLLVLSVPIAVGGYLLSGRLIRLFYESGYDNSIPALKILILAIPWIFVNSINMFLLYAANRQRQATNIVLISTALNIGLNLILIPRLSYIGAAISTVAVEIINFFIFSMFVYVVFKMQLKNIKMWLKPILAAFFMGIYIFYFKGLNLFFLIISAGLIYFLLLLAFRAFDEDDKYIFRRIFLKKS